MCLNSITSTVYYMFYAVDTPPSILPFYPTPLLHLYRCTYKNMMYTINQKCY